LRAIACSTQTSHGQERQNIEGIMRIRFVKHDHVHGPRWKHDIIALGPAVFTAVGHFQDKRNVALDHLLDLASCHFDLTIATFVDAINGSDNSATVERFALRRWNATSGRVGKTTAPKAFGAKPSMHSAP
jgi:hypothetical protein